MKIDTTLSKNEYGLVRILKALANENRFIILKNLQKGPCYATELNGPLKISRPALGKHVRILIIEGLVEQKHVVEGGTAKTVYELTNFGGKIAERINGLNKDIEVITSQISKELNEELMEVKAQIDGITTILEGLEKRLNNNQISHEDYESLKSDYEKKRNDLERIRHELEKRLESE